MASLARAGAYDDQTPPGSWLVDLVPESLPEPAYPDYARSDSIEKARVQMQAGQYRRALVTLEGLDKGDRVQIALIRGECRLALGRFDEALAGLTDPDPAVQTLRARVQIAAGDFTGAAATLRQTIAAHPDLIPPHYYLGLAMERRGDIDGARRAYGWFVADPHNLLQKWLGQRDSFTSAEDATLLGRAIDRWATLNLVYPKEHALHDIVLGMFVRAYDVIDRDYTPAHIAAAEYFLSHDDPNSAQDELKHALAANPRDVQAWKLVGTMGLQGFDFSTVDKAVRNIRLVSADSIDADLLEARNYMAQQVPRLALPPLTRALARQPRNIEALGLLAGAQALLLHDQECDKTLQRADQIDPNNSLAYEEVADALGAMRQYPRAAAMYKIAIARAPWSAASRNGLGLLDTQSGDEQASRHVLEAARAIDPFNLATTNYLRLLDLMDSYAHRESAHFIVIYDPQADPIIPEYFSDYLESIYPIVTGTFHYEPKVKTMIEVFPTHDEFSVRTTGAPWLPTVGASTGRVIALVAPRKGERTMGPFNWAQVLRHEFTHTVTLGETDNRIAHWFTEGLAVQQENTPVRWEWVPMLYHAVKDRELLPLDQLTWGFVRPRRPIERQLAYAESSWICLYIEQAYGHWAILGLCDQFRDGHDQAEAFQNVLHKSENDFFDEFQKWCDKQIASWGYDEKTSAEYEQLRQQADDLISQEKYAEALKVYQRIAAIRPMDMLPHQRLAGLYLNPAINQPAKAAEQLDILAKVELNNDMYTKGAARLYRDAGDLATAQKRALKAVYIDPYDASAHKLLAQIDEKLNDTAGEAREQRVIKELEHWQEKNTPAD